MSKAYKEYIAELTEEQADLTRDEVMELMQQRSEYQLDLDNLPSVGEHCWIDRGEVVSCEGVGHPSHRHFKRR